jgi:hypothetical protein
VARAGVDLAPGPAWLLLRVGGRESVAELRELPQVDAQRFDAALEDLRARGLYGDAEITPAGQAVRDQLVAARTDCLRELIRDWQPDEHPELDPLLSRLARELGHPPRAEPATATA